MDYTYKDITSNGRLVSLKCTLARFLIRNLIDYSEYKCERSRRADPQCVRFLLFMKWDMESLQVRSHAGVREIRMVAERLDRERLLDEGRPRRNRRVTR